MTTDGHSCEASVAAMADPLSASQRVEGKSRLWAFFVLTFVWSWTLWLLSSAVEAQSMVAAEVLSALASFGPGIAAIAMVCFSGGRAGLQRWLRRCLQWRVGWRWIALAALLPLTVMAAAALAQAALGGKLSTSPAHGQVFLIPAAIVWVFLAGGPVGEEFGWRGYALPALQRRLGWRKASLALGTIWGLWHMPLFTMVGTTQSQTPIHVFMPMIIGLSVLFAWIFNRTRHSVVPALVLHTAFNTCAFVIPVLASEKEQRPSETAVAVLLLIAFGLLLSPDRTAASHLDAMMD